MRRFLSLLLSVVLLLATVTACIPIQAVDTTFDLKANEAWNMQVKITMTKEVADLLIPRMSNLQEQWQQYQEKGISISMGEIKQTDTGQSILPIVASGQGFELLNNEIFGGEQVVILDPENPEQYLFSFGSDVMGGLNLTGALSYTITLNAGKIADTNGEKKDGNTVVWVNPTSRCTATFRKAADLTWLWYTLGGLGGVGVVGGGIFAVVKSRKRQPSGMGVAYTPGFEMPGSTPTPYMSYDPAPSAPAAAKFCTNCGSPLPAGAGFCPACGQKN